MDRFIRKIIFETLVHITLALGLVSLLYGVTSWYCFYKFRNYRNFVFLNTILVNLLYVIIIHRRNFYSSVVQDFISTKEIQLLMMEIRVTVIFYLLCVKNHWLVINSHLFYSSIVKVFNGHIQRKYLKSNLFGWGVPLLTTIIDSGHYFCDSQYDWIFHIFRRGILVLPLFINTMLYIFIIFSLFRGIDASTPSAINKWRRFYTATLIFLLSDVGIFIYFIVYVLIGMKYTYFILELINPTLLSVFLIAVKSNRKIWFDWYINKIHMPTATQSLHDIKIVHEIFSQISFDSELKAPAVSD